jgi:competence protein ComGC
MIAGISYELFIVLTLLIASLAILVLVLFKNKNTILKMQISLDDAKNALLKRQSRAYQMGANTESGNLHQILGEFKMLDDYEELITLSTTSKAPSLDMIGIKGNQMDFIEFKKKGAGLTKPERKIKAIIESKNVQYIIKDVDIPKRITVETR